jgi:peptidyl-prolyl cis-trans isomerase A (cyclophilin A)
MHRRNLLKLPVLGCAALAPAVRSQAAQPVLTRVETALGAFTISVDPSRAPITVENFLAYVDRRWLDGGKVYRIVTPANQSAETKFKIEVVQWGMDAPDDQPPPRPAIAHETTRTTGLKHLDGTISMARNGPGTATSEFFICIGAQPALDFGGGRNPDGQGFAAFGQVVSGMDVVRAIYAKGRDDDQYIEPPIPVVSVKRV